MLMRPNSELLDEVATKMDGLPHWRLHVHPGAAPWIGISVAHRGLHPHVQVVPDPACREVGLGWLQHVSAEQWAEMRGLVGHRVTMLSELGFMTGTLVSLTRSEAVIDLTETDRRFLRWIEIGPA